MYILYAVIVVGLAVVLILPAKVKKSRSQRKKNGRPKSSASVEFDSFVSLPSLTSPAPASDDADPDFFRGTFFERDGQQHFAFEKRSLLTPAELDFYRVLAQAFPGRYRVFAKVRWADLFAIKPEFNDNRSQWQTAWNRISRKHVDFVLCDFNSLALVCLVELDDRSHQLEDRKKRDQQLDQICEVLGLPIVHQPWLRSYSPDQVKKRIEDAIGPA